jgi:hypothetical protein
VEYGGWYVEIGLVGGGIPLGGKRAGAVGDSGFGEFGGFAGDSFGGKWGGVGFGDARDGSADFG